MIREEIVRYCLAKQGAREDYPFGPDPLVVKVGSKMFALLSAPGQPVHISLKCEPEIAYLLRQQYPAVKPGYHMNKQHWNTVACDGSVPDEELRWMIDQSYALVARSLKKAEAKELGIVL